MLGSKPSLLVDGNALRRVVMILVELGYDVLWVVRYGCADF